MPNRSQKQVSMETSNQHMQTLRHFVVKQITYINSKVPGSNEIN